MGTETLTDEEIEQIFRGVLSEHRHDILELVATVQAVRGTVPPEPPTPSPQLAALFTGAGTHALAAPRQKLSPRRALRCIAAGFASLGLGVQVALGTAAAGAAVGAVGVADRLPDHLQQHFDNAFDLRQPSEQGNLHPNGTHPQGLSVPEHEPESADDKTTADVRNKDKPRPASVNAANETDTPRAQPPPDTKERLRQRSGSERSGSVAPLPRTRVGDPEETSDRPVPRPGTVDRKETEKKDVREKRGIEDTEDREDTDDREDTGDREDADDRGEIEDDGPGFRGRDVVTPEPADRDNEED